MWLTRLALRNPILILMVSLMTVVLGLTSLGRLSVDLFPAINLPVIRIATFYPGAGPGDIEKSITQPLERAVSAAPGVDRIESTSRQGVSLISAWFGYGANLDNAEFEVSQRVAQVLSSLPPGIQQPFILKFDVSNIPVLAVTVSGDGLDEKQLYDLAYNTIEPQLERLPGVASANVAGGVVRELTVRIHAAALRARGLDVLQVVEAVRRTNLILPSGHIEAGDRDYNVFANTQVETARDLENVVVASSSPAGHLVRLRDVATVEDGAADQSEIVRIDGRRGVYLRVLKQPDGNTIGVVDAVKAALPNLRGVPPNVRLTFSFDQSAYVRAAVKALEHEALQGGVLAIIVILIFLLSWRATGIIAVAIPLSIVATFILLYFAKQTLNVFTLGGLALAVGRLVDDSIVELENIHRHLALGQSRRAAVLAAAEEVAMPILVSTITTIIVFFPVLFLTGVAQSLFVPLALTISFSLIVSFLVSRTVTPLLCLHGLKAHAAGTAPKGIAGWFERAFVGMENAYENGLRRALNHRGKVIVFILLLFAGSLFLKRGIGTEFFPESDEAQITVNYRAPVGTRVGSTETLTAHVEDIVDQAMRQARGPGDPPLVTTSLSDTGLPIGRTAIFSPNSGPHSGNLQVNLVPRLSRSLTDQQLAARLRSALRDTLPGSTSFLFVGGIIKRILNFGAAAPIDVEILGYDLATGSDFARVVLARLRELRDDSGRPVLTDLLVSREANYPELDVTVDREKAGVLGVSQQQVAQSVLTGLVGNTEFSPIPYTDPKTGNEFFVNVRLDDADRRSIADLADLPLRASSGRLVPLSSIAHITRASGPVVINRKYLQRIVDVTANVAPGVDLGSAGRAVRGALAGLSVPDGFSVKLGGQTEEQEKAFSGLMFAAGLAIILVYMVLASQFKSLLDPLVIMFSVPLGLTGVFAMLRATGTSLSVNSFMGIIMMVGIVVSNGVLLVDFANVLQRRGVPLKEATLQAARTRLRPILMTTIATVVGLVPMALGIGEGSETNLPLARAVIGGLSVSTGFTLFLVPALYTLLDRWRRESHDDDDGDNNGDVRAQVGAASRAGTSEHA